MRRPQFGGWLVPKYTLIFQEVRSPIHDTVTKFGGHPVWLTEAHWPLSRSTGQGVEPTNNAAARALRPAVLWRKGSGGSDSVAGSRFAERLLPVVASCRQQGRPVLDFLVATVEAALRGSSPPSLLPAGQGG